MIKRGRFKITARKGDHPVGSREDGTMNSENQGKEEDDTASRTEEECFADAALFNRVMEEGSANAGDEEYVDDGSFDAQLANADQEFDQDPFETLPEMDIILHNIFDI
jgi:hypothetical protein